MAERNVLVITGKEKGFLENSICDALKKKELIVDTASVVDATLSQKTIDADFFFVVDGGSGVDSYQHILSMLKDLCHQYNKKMLLYGNPENIEQMNKILTADIIADSFVRPADVADVADKVVKAFEREEYNRLQKKILVVDDSGVMLRTIMGWLENKYSVSLANSAASAFAAIQKDRPDLILLDYEMPVCSGGQFLEMLRNEPDSKNIPVIFLTARSDAETVNEVLELKPDGYILKTTPEEKVVNTIAEFFLKQSKSI